MEKTNYRENLLFKIAELLEPKDKFCLLIMVFLSIISSMFELLAAGTIVIFTQSLVNPHFLENKFLIPGMENISQLDFIFMSSMLVTGVYLLKNIFNVFEIFFQHHNIQLIKHRFKLRILNAYTFMTYESYLGKKSSEIISLLSLDIEHFFNNGLISIVIIFSESLVLFSICGFLLYVAPYITIFLFISISILYKIISLYFSPKIHKSGQIHRETFEKSISCVSELLRSFKEIKIDNKSQFFSKMFENESIKNTKAQALHYISATSPRIIIEALFAILFAVSINVMILRDYSLNEILTIMGLLSYSCFRIMPVLNRIMTQFNVLKATKACIFGVHKAFMELPKSFMYPSLPGFKFNNLICFENVSYTYENSKNPTLEDLSIKLYKTDCIGVVGKSGAGKSTFINLLLGLLTPTQGSITIDGHYPLRCTEWLNLVGYVPQQINLINDTIEKNIAFGIAEEDIDQALLKKVVKDVQLLDLINQLPQGLKTMVGENGAFLSGGERQRIGVARALYKKPEVLIFDEFTSSLDNKTEEKLLEMINLNLQDKTIIIVAHRLSTLKFCNKLFEVKNKNIYAKNILEETVLKSNIK